MIPPFLCRFKVRKKAVCEINDTLPFSLSENNIKTWVIF
jgi:hypothetical protein